jgi:hypothetical protein
VRISAEQLCAHTGRLEPREGIIDTLAVILADAALSQHQKQALIQVYESFCHQHAAAVPASPSESAS